MVLAITLIVAAISPAPGLALVFDHFFNVTHSVMDRALLFGQDQWMLPQRVPPGFALKPLRWNTTFSDSPTWVEGAVGQGTAMRSFSTSTRFSSPTLIGAFFSGKGWSIYGNWSGLPSESLSYYTGTSNVDINPQGHDVLSFATDGAAILQKPTLNLLTVPYSDYTVTITSVVVTWGVQSNGDPNYNISNHAHAETFMDDAGQLNSFYRIKNPKAQIERMLGTDPNTTMEFPHLNLVNNSVTFSAPANTTFMAIEGAVGPDSGGFTVTGNPPSSLAYGYGSEFFQITSYDTWFSPSVLYMLPLDPNLQYDFTVDSVDGLIVPNTKNDTKSGVRLRSVTFYSNGGPYTPPGPTNAPNNDTTADKPPKTSVPAGPIAGGVVGGVFGVALFGLLIFLLLRRRKKLRVTTSKGMEKFDIDTVVNPNLTPFPTFAQRVPKSGYDDHDLTSRFGDTNATAGGYSDANYADTGSPIEYRDPLTKPTDVPAPALEATATDTVPSVSAPVEHRQSQPLTHTRAPRIEEDAGELEEVLPPTYDPRWEQRFTARVATAVSGIEGTGSGESGRQRGSERNMFSHLTPGEGGPVTMNKDEQWRYDCAT